MITELKSREVDGWRGHIDLILPEGEGPFPTLLYLHGGGWRMGSKASVSMHAPAWTAMGLAVASADYRLLHVAPAPAAVEDAVAALDWLKINGEGYGLDADRIVLAVHSAGGLLALSAAFRRCDEVKAVIAWSAQADLVAYRAQRAARADPVAWLEEADDPAAVAGALSPLHNVRLGVPPTILIHSDADPRSPYEDARRLAGALAEASVPVELLTMASDGHLTNEQPEAEVARGHQATRVFLERIGVLTGRVNPVTPEVVRKTITETTD